MLAKRPPLSLFQVQTFGGTYSAGSVTGASVIGLAPGFFWPCFVMGGLPHGGIIVPLISPLLVSATRASPLDNSLWRSARSPCYGSVSAPQQNKKRATSGEECTMLRSKWLTPFFGIMLAIAGGGYASAQ